MKEDRSAFKILTVTPTEKKPLGRWENNIRMDLNDIGFNTSNWVDLAQDRDYWRTLMNAALNLRFHKPWSQLSVYQRLYVCFCMCIYVYVCPV